MMLFDIIFLLKMICFKDELFRNKKNFLDIVCGFNFKYVKWIFFNVLFCNLRKVLCSFFELRLLFLFRLRNFR